MVQNPGHLTKDCPECGQKLSQIIYGTPSKEKFMELVDQGYVIGSSRIIFGQVSPKLKCRKCGYSE